MLELRGGVWRLYQYGHQRHCPFRQQIIGHEFVGPTSELSAVQHLGHWILDTNILDGRV